MKINYTAILLTVLALVGLTLYRLLTPDAFIVLCSEKNKPETMHWAKSTDGIKWNIISSAKPLVIADYDDVQNQQIIRVARSRFMHYVTGKNKILSSKSDDLVHWERPLTVVENADAVLDFPGPFKFKILENKKAGTELFYCNNALDNSGIYYTCTENSKLVEPIKIIHSTVDIEDFQIFRLNGLYVLALMSVNGNREEVHIDFYTSAGAKNGWVLEDGTMTDSLEWLQTVGLQKNNKEFWLYGNQNGIISVKLNGNGDGITTEKITQKSLFPATYKIICGTAIQKDILKKAEKELKSRS
ncbi:hypothetical protein [Saccharicrinis sp. FJH54]|uniref:hypothetical protein n=1 Tax=Saccharicrinis sp. FJH54 TaxID=3344665 RepID=UPI0035D41054